MWDENGIWLGDDPSFWGDYYPTDIGDYFPDPTDGTMGPFQPGDPNYFGPNDGVSGPLPGAPGGSPGGSGGGGGSGGPSLASLGQFGARLWQMLNGGGGGSGGGGGYTGMEWLTRLLEGGGGLGGGILQNPLLMPSLMAAMQQWKDADRISSSTESWAQQADPFGDQRDFYKGQLRSLMEDPESYLKNDPGYQSTLKLALGPVQSRLRAKGYGNSGNMLSELNRHSGDITNTYLGQMADRLGRFAGSQFGPETSARLREAGLRGSIDSRNSALNSLMYPFLATAFNRPPGGNTTINNNGGGGNQGGGNGGFNWTDILNIFQPSSGQTPGFNNETDPTGYRTPYNPDNPYDINGL